MKTMYCNYFCNSNRIVEPRRPGSFFIDTSLLGRIHSITDPFVGGDGRTTTTTTTNTTTTTAAATTNYRDNPSNDGSALDLTLSKMMNGTPNSNNRRLR